MRVLKLKDSTSIKTASYNKEDKKLSVTFMGGRTYDYQDVPESTINLFEELATLKKGSVGSIFYGMIRNKFKYTKVD